ncbi:MAG: FkbM family methyltransferase [Paenibacillaceae bacterium]
MNLKNITPFRQMYKLYMAKLNMASILRSLIISNEKNTQKIVDALEKNERKNEQNNIFTAQNKEIDLYEYFGLKLLLDRTSTVDNCIIENGWWESEQFEFFMSLWEYARNKDNLFLDIGAYFGLYSLRARQTGIFKEVYAFEADKYNYMQLQAQLFLNTITDIVSVNKAISNKCRLGLSFASTSHPDKNRGGVWLLDEEAINPDNSTFNVECITLDSMFPDMTGKTIVAKMDVEGHEAKALEGMKNLIYKNKVIMQIEALESLGSGQHISEQVDELGLRFIKRIGEDNYYTNITIDELKY